MMIPNNVTISRSLKFLFIALVATLIETGVFALPASADRIEEIRMELDGLSRRCPEYFESVDISVGRMRLSELLRTIAQMKKVNLSVRDDFDCIVSCTFTRSRIDDLIVFLCREYDLDIEIYGNIVSIFRYTPPIEPYREPEILFDKSDSLISFQFREKRLGDVTDSISALSSESVIVPVALRESLVSATANKVSVGDALEILARSNGLNLFVVQGDRQLWCLASASNDKDLSSRQRMSNRFTVTQADTTVIMPLKHRSIDNLQEIIPDEIKSKVQLIASGEMNAFIIHGAADPVNMAETFIRRIDIPVPLIEIDVLIVESSKSAAREIGIEVGASEVKATTIGGIGSGVDMRLGFTTTLQLLNKINGFSSINLGDAADRLYIDIKLLEEAGLVKVESTPKLATLNGQKAILSKGETTHYKEISSSFYSSQTPVENQSYTWKEVNADLVITIIPYVSLDSLVTLNIDIQQNEFGPRMAVDAPPDINKRGFKSIVRVSDGDVVLLGGIDTTSDRTTAKGLPWLARVPILRWIGGKDKRAKTEQKMNVFIRAKIIN